MGNIFRYVHYKFKLRKQGEGYGRTVIYESETLLNPRNIVWFEVRAM